MSLPEISTRRLTPAGAGAVSVVEVQGPPSVFDDEPRLFQAANGHAVKDQPVGRVCYGEWGRETPESIVLCRTGPAVTEIQCHGGQAAVDRILSDLGSRGCVTLAVPMDMSRQQSVIETECLDALIRATTLRTADILLQQRDVLPRVIRELEGMPRDHAKRQVESLLEWSEFGIHLSQPWQVVLCGRPNVGKSSLINALVGYARSIVFDQPGTTRDVVSVETALDGWPIELSDTAGLRGEADALESAGIERARQRLEDADLRIVLIDVSQPPSEEDQKLLAAWGDGIVVAHKCDLDDAWGAAKPQAAINVSAKTRAGVDRLAEEIVRRLVPCVPAPMTSVPVTCRQFDRLEELWDAIHVGRKAEEVERRIVALLEG